MQLNPKQLEACHTINWPLLIIAWAWSWKTATLTSRVEYMIKEKNIPASNIACVTFTNKAAKEMRERIWKKLWVEIGNNIYKNRNFPLIWTFHSIWIFILKEVLNLFWDLFENIWIKKDFVIYDETDKLSVLKSIIKDDLWLEEKTYPARQIAFYISNAKNSLVTAKWYEKEIDSHIKEIVYKVYLKYEEKLSQNNAMDFDDILVKTLSLLKNQKILDYYQEKYKYIMVDEYQDTNAPQYNIVKLLASKYRNLAVVWDDWQSIYSRRWADMRNIINFKKDYEEAVIIKLEQNYRSTKNIIKAANHIIKNNSSSLKKELRTDNIAWEKIRLIDAPDDKTEASIIADIIKGNQERNSYKDYLILYRTNWQSRILEEALMIKQIPYKVIWGLKFYDRKEIKDMLAYLKIIHNPNDVISFKRIINTPSRKIWWKTIEILDNYKNNFWLNYLDIIKNIDEIEEIRAWAKSSLNDFYEIYKKLEKLSYEVWVSDLVRKIIEIIWYEDYLRENFSKEEFESKTENLIELENVASEYKWMEPRESLSQFLEEVALISDLDSKDDSMDFVTLMTIHTSKWLEYENVFIAWMEEGIFPHIRSISDNYQLEEERRLMYVAMTRAKKELYISRAKERFYFWDYVRNPESRFLKEIPLDFLEDYDISSFVSGNSFFSSSFWSKFDYNETKEPIRKIKATQNNDIKDFSIWTRINHHKFWNWIITELNSEIASIAFSWIWIKKMNIKIAPIKVI